MSTREEIAVWTNLTEARVRVRTLGGLPPPPPSLPPRASLSRAAQQAASETAACSSALPAPSSDPKSDVPRPGPAAPTAFFPPTSNLFSSSTLSP